MLETENVRLSVQISIRRLFVSDLPNNRDAFAQMRNTSNFQLSKLECQFDFLAILFAFFIYGSIIIEIVIEMYVLYRLRGIECVFVKSLSHGCQIIVFVFKEPYFEPIVNLPLVKTSTNEENEVEMCKIRARLYRFDTEQREWKVKPSFLLCIGLRNTYLISFIFLGKRDWRNKTFASS